MSGLTLPLLKRDERAVSVIVGEVLMVGIMVVAISVVARAYIVTRSTPSRFVFFSVQVENDLIDNYQVKLTIKHVGGDTIIDPVKYLAVWGGKDSAGVQENIAYERGNGFSIYDKFELGDNVTLFVHCLPDNVPKFSYRIRVGDRYRVRIYDNYSEKVLYEKVLTVAASS
jgi:hypothetical protein